MDDETTVAKRRRARGFFLGPKVTCLMPVAGPGLLESFLLTNPETIIGRAPDVDLRLADPRVSRKHCKILVTSRGFEIQDLQSTNGTFVNEIKIKTQHLEDGDLIRVGETILRLHHLYRSELGQPKELYRKVTKDNLTDLNNRAFILERIEEETSRSKRHGLPLSLIMIEIDHFEAINHEYGRPAADSVLRKVASILKRSVRRENTLGRFGHKEFIILGLHTDGKGAEVLGERLRRQIEEYAFPHDRGHLKATISVGIATFPQDARDHAGLMERVDEALHRAQASGRNRVVCYSSSGEAC